MVKVLISDKMSPRAEEIFKARGIEVDFKPGMTPEELKLIVNDYQGLAMRSSTNITEDILSVAPNLKVIGRAGIGVDNIDIAAATNAGTIVMNTPFGNAITTAEHTVAMMFALARQIPQASASTHGGKWEKSKFMGQELFSKTLGIIGCGNIGAIVASRALGIQMKVLAYDPYLTQERATEMGVQKAELEDIFENADFITLHTPLTDKTRGLIGSDNIAKMKKGVYIINCARGGLIDEDALKQALDAGHVAGAALDVYSVEPAKENVLFGHEKVVCTPHLGASTVEAQVNVAVQVAEQISDYLLTGAVTNAINMASISAEDAPQLQPYMSLAEQMGNFAGQITRNAITAIEIEYEGHVAEVNTKPLTAILLAGILSPMMEGVNIVSAPARAAERGIDIKTSNRAQSDAFQTLINIVITTEQGQHNVTGTLFGNNAPRIVNVDTVPIETELTEHMLFIRNLDQPGLIGQVGSILGDAGLNIAGFRLGQMPSGGKAIAIVSIDEKISDDLLTKIDGLSQVERVQAITF